jgi:transcriptional regulator with XRE-family HTH domain
MIGITYQQIQSYEKGTNRLTAGQLHAVAIALGTEVADFFAHAEIQPADVDQSDYLRRLDDLMGDVLRIASPRQAIDVVARTLADRADMDER